MKYVYPAIFHKDDSGRFSVLFPDFDVATCGDDLDDAIAMAEDCRALQLKGLIEYGEIIEGEIPNKQIKLISAWTEIHKDELLAIWYLAISEQPLYKIDPLK